MHSVHLATAPMPRQHYLCGSGMVHTPYADVALHRGIHMTLYNLRLDARCPSVQPRRQRLALHTRLSSAPPRSANGSWVSPQLATKQTRVRPGVNGLCGGWWVVGGAQGKWKAGSGSAVSSGIGTWEAFMQHLMSTCLRPVRFGVSKQASKLTHVPSPCPRGAKEQQRGMRAAAPAACSLCQSQHVYGVWQWGTWLAHDVYEA
jgi:hypothetical protein